MRISLSQEHIGAFLQMIVKRAIVQEISNTDIIDRVAAHSAFLKKELLPQ